MLCLHRVFFSSCAKKWDSALRRADRTLLRWVTDSLDVVTACCVRDGWRLYDSDPACVQHWPPRVHERWLAPSLKQSHYKVDMTSVTPAIITGQDSWPLPVAEHVAIRRNAAHWLAVEPRSESCFIMLSIVLDSQAYFSAAANCLVCFSSTENWNSGSHVWNDRAISARLLLLNVTKMFSLLFCLFFKSHLVSCFCKICDKLHRPDKFPVVSLKLGWM